MKKEAIEPMCPLQRRVKEELPPESTSFMRAWSIVSPVLIYYIVTNCCVAGVAFFIQWISLTQGEWKLVAHWIQQYSAIISGVVSGMSMLAGAAAVYYMFRKETPQIALPVSRKKDVWLLVALGAVTALCINILFGLLQITSGSEKYAEVAKQQFALPLWLGILFYGVASPFAEEIVFRGIVYNRLHRQFGRWAAIIGASVIFGAYHGNMVQALYGFVLGLFMAVLYEKYGSFLVPLILHSASNVCIYITSCMPGGFGFVMNPVACAGLGIVVGILMVVAFRPEKNAGKI